jgi:hypothetical protein
MTYYINTSLALINNPRKFGTWIGLVNDVSNSNKFIWLDSTKFNYTYWAPNEPNGDNLQTCVHIADDYKNMWNDLPCDSTIGSYICERKLPLKTAKNGQNDIGTCPIGYHFSNETLKCHTVSL